MKKRGGGTIRYSSPQSTNCGGGRVPPIPPRIDAPDFLNCQFSKKATSMSPNDVTRIFPLQFRHCPEVTEHSA